MNMEQPSQRHVLIRPAVANDLPQVETVARETWRQTYAGHIDSSEIEQFLNDNYNQAVLERVLEADDVTLLVASAIDHVVGYVTAGHSSAEIFAIYVLPDWQGAGVGRRLWHAAVTALRSLGHEACYLWVLEGNERARRFYERMNGRPTGRREYAVGNATIQEVRYEFTFDA